MKKDRRPYTCDAWLRPRIRASDSIAADLIRAHPSDDAYVSESDVIPTELVRFELSMIAISDGASIDFTVIISRGLRAPNHS